MLGTAGWVVFGEGGMARSGGEGGSQAVGTLKTLSLGRVLLSVWRRRGSAAPPPWQVGSKCCEGVWGAEGDRAPIVFWTPCCEGGTVPLGVGLG